MGLFGARWPGSKPTTTADMAILLIAAEAAELKPFEKHLINARKLNWPIDYAYEGIVEGRRMLLAANGAGPKLAAQAVEVASRAIKGAELSSSRLEAIVSVGFCGAIKPGLRPAQVIIGTEVLDPRDGSKYPCAAINATSEHETGVVASLDRVITHREEKAKLFASGAVAVDMESLAVAQAAKRAAVPFFCVKTVSDLADETFRIDFNQMRTPEGRIARGKIVLYVITHPWMLGELLRLRRRSQDAARALGEFLVSCRINLNGDPAIVE
jgi:adenosylhomocysteine nucleosidase